MFIENAFKHGISYREESFVSVSINISENTVEFHCLNSNHPAPANHTPGIGLSNVRQRLDLIYGENHTLETEITPEAYNVNLTIPVYETPHHNN